jgi:hypothetical protein
LRARLVDVGRDQHLVARLDRARARDHQERVAADLAPADVEDGYSSR